MAEAVTVAPKDWMTIDEIVSRYEEQGKFDHAFNLAATQRAKKAWARRQIRSQKDADGVPVWVSVQTTDQDGNVIRAYKQELLFNVEDYRKVIDYHAHQSSHHQEMAAFYARRCQERLQVQLQLFNLDDAPKDMAVTEAPGANARVDRERKRLPR